MSTLGALKAEIADDLLRSDLSTQIASEISNAIRYFQNKRFYFNETRGETFVTVAAQAVYSSTDDTAIPDFIEIDQITVTDGTSTWELDLLTPKEWEIATALATGSRPTGYAYFNQSLMLYPTPDAAYTVRMIGHIKKTAPSTDEESGNVWMTEAYQLLRYRAAKMVSAMKMLDSGRAQLFANLEGDEFQRLKAETAARVTSNSVAPTEF
jgi:hypothetical protein